MSNCPKCSKEGTEYFQYRDGRTYSYYRHVVKNVSSTCYIGRCKDRLIKSKSIDSTLLSSEDKEILIKIEKRLISSRNKTQAELVRRIINSV